MWSSLWAWLTDPANWQGTTGIPQRILEHLGYTGLSVLLALVISLPIGAVIGHTGRGGVGVVGFANGLRALPSLGVLTIVVLVWGLGLAPPIIALTILAIPPALAGTYAGIRAVDPAVVDAARGVGMREWEVLLKVEVPNAMPLIFGGVRNATLQVVATATIAAYVALGGLGRFVIDGLAQLNYSEMLGGALLVAVLAIVLDLVLVGVQRLVVSRGLVESGVSRRRASRRRAANETVSDQPEPVHMGGNSA
ncbi:MAG TPA: ABC transporter permease [Pseudonocardiaceae bacterium]|jgi:osmoprotectant transport system permease protein|nr:ABC transporter permease [Pseudonocardiaceae bacterium]